MLAIPTAIKATKTVAIKHTVIFLRILFITFTSITLCHGQVFCKKTHVYYRGLQDGLSIDFVYIRQNPVTLYRGAHGYRQAVPPSRPGSHCTCFLLQRGAGPKSQMGVLLGLSRPYRRSWGVSAAAAPITAGIISDRKGRKPLDISPAIVYNPCQNSKEGDPVPSGIRTFRELLAGAKKQSACVGITSRSCRPNIAVGLAGRDRYIAGVSSGELCKGVPATGRRTEVVPRVIPSSVPLGAGGVFFCPSEDGNDEAIRDGPRLEHPRAGRVGRGL